MRALVALVVLVGAAAQGCAGSQACTEVGGFDGVGVEIPTALFVASGTVTIEVCDAQGCASTRQRLRPTPRGPVGRGTGASFEDLGRTFAPGPVAVTVTESNAAGELVATSRGDVELSRSYPNGRECDGKGYVSGTLTMEPGDRV